MKRGRMRLAWLSMFAVTLLPVAARADSWVTPYQGHIAFGYAKLFANDAPGGSLSFSAGIDRPIGERLNAGVDLDYNLLGSNTVIRGSLVADVDYSTIEALAMLHWQPSWKGPVGRVSGGIGVMAARATVSSSGAGGFQDLPVDELAPAFAGEFSLMSRRPAPVRVGLETGVHVGMLSHDTWTVWDIRFAIHY